MSLPDPVPSSMGDPDATGRFGRFGGRFVPETLMPAFVAHVAVEPGAAAPDALRIVIDHYPDVALTLGPDAPVDLVVAGHTHGGQVVVPGFGPPLTLTSVPRTVAAGGLHRLNGRPIYVSRGVGMERARAPRLRLFCSPEVTLLTIVGQP